MDLIYLYIGNLDRPIRNRGICFSDSFDVEYDAETKQLHIYPKEKGITVSYGRAVKGLDLIVGKNGTGKTTILEILGLPKSQRLNVTPLQNDQDGEKERYTWFALYHIEGDRFAMEGYWYDTLDFLSGEEYSYLHPIYSISFCYNYDRQRPVGGVDVLQDIPAADGKRRVNDELFYIMYRTEPESAWYKRPYPLSGEDMNMDVICQRIHAGHSGYGSITRYLFDSVHNREFSGRMGSRPAGGTVKLQLRQANKSLLVTEKDENPYELEERGIRIAGKLLYGEKEAFLEPFFEWETQFPGDERRRRFSKRETMVLLYLQELACHYLTEDPDTFPTEVQEAQEDAFAGYEEWKAYLLQIMEERDEIDFALARRGVEGLEKIPEEYFLSDTKAQFRLKDMEENFLAPLMEVLDLNGRVEEHTVNHRYFLSVEFSGLSTGEVQYLDLHASLYHAVKNCGHREGDTCVLLLDEPDSRFHPEWSRQFIRNLTQLLDGAEFNRYRYQVIICTHSPLLVSDVPKEQIHCLKRDPHTGLVELQPSRYGFMSSLDDILTDSFYTESVFGAFAEEYVNGIIENLRWMEGVAANGGYNAIEMKEQISILEKRIAPIDDRVICQSLLLRLERIRARLERGREHDPDLS